MVILKDCTSKPNCEVEMNIKSVNNQSVSIDIYLRFGNNLSAIHANLYFLKEDFINMLNDLKQLDNSHLSMLEPLDPGLCIYHIPQFGSYYYPNHGILVPERNDEREHQYKLIFVLHAGEIKHFYVTECGPAVCLIVKQDQINEFVDSLIFQINNFPFS